MRKQLINLVFGKNKHIKFRSMCLKKLIVVVEAVLMYIYAMNLTYVAFQLPPGWNIIFCFFCLVFTFAFLF